MERDLDLDLFNSLPVQRLLPIYRNEHRFYDSDRMPLDHYAPRISARTALDNYARSSNTFNARSNRASTEYTSHLRNMDDKMRDMRRNMDEMYRDFSSLGEPAPLLPLTSGAGLGTSGLELAKRIENPVIKDIDGKKKLHLEFDVKHFKPEEISVRTKDRFLEIHAKHEEKSESGTAFREYRRVFNVPDSIEPEALRSELSPDGVLTIEADVQGAVQAANEPKKIAIAHE